MGSGYILKIRYAGKWNMRTCMEAQQKTCLKAVAKSKGKGKKTEADCRKESSAPREVAVYNERDLKLAKELITTIVASEEIIAKGGKLKPKTTKEDAEKGRDQALKDLVDKYGEESDKGLGHLESAKDLIRKIVNNEMILTSYGEKPEAEKTPAENVKEAKKERIRATNELKKLIPTFGPQ